MLISSETQNNDLANLEFEPSFGLESLYFSDTPSKTKIDCWQYF